MTYPIPRNDLCMSDSMPFCQKWQARIGFPISFIDDDPGKAFHAAYSSLQPGDEIAVCAFEKDGGDFAYLRETATYRIIAKHKPDETMRKGGILEACRVGDIFEVPKRNQALTENGVLALDIVPTGQKAYEVRDRAGNVIESFVGVDADDALRQATEFRDREQGRSGVVGLTMKKGFGKHYVCDPSGAIKAEFTTKTEAEAFMRSGGQKAA